MKHHVFIASVVASAVALAAGAALAKPAGHGQQLKFEQFDTNGDGQISREEMYAQRSARLEQADIDGDGVLTAAEIEAAAVERAKTRAQKMLERLDANGDGALSVDEMRSNARFERRFERADRDGDGAISKSEFDQARERMGKRHGSY